MWYKWRFLEIYIHFIVFTDQPLFASKQTFARIDFLRQGGRLVGEKVLIMLNFLRKSWQSVVSWQVNKKTSGQVNELIVLFSFLEKCVFSPWQCSSKLDRVQLAYWKRSFLVCWHKHVHFWHKNIRNIKKRPLLFPHYVPLTVRFQLVANALNALRQVAFSNTTAFCHRQMWQYFSFYCIFVQYFVHERSVCLGFTA